MDKEEGVFFVRFDLVFYGEDAFDSAPAFGGGADEGAGVEFFEAG